jgi:hypothetical protein
MYEVDINRDDRLDRIIRLFVKSNGPQFRECTLLGDIYASLLRAYLWHDPLGYEHEIREGIDYVVDSLPLPQDTYVVVLWTKMQHLLELNEYVGVLRTAKSYFRYCENQDTHQAWGYVTLIQAYYHLAEYLLALQTAQDLESTAERAGNDSLIFTALKWQYTILFKLQDDDAMREISREMAKFDLSRLSGYDALHEAQYEYDKQALGWFGKLALLREAEYRIHGAVKGNRPYLECKTRLRRLSAFLSLPFLVRWIVRLLFQMPSEAAQLAESRAAAEKLIKPEPKLAWIARVEHGDWSDF